MTKQIMGMLLALSISALSCSALASPIYVDGSGNGVIYGSASDANAANGDNEAEYTPGGSSGSSAGGMGHYELPQDEEEEIDPNAPQKWEYESQEMLADWGGRTVTVLSLGTVVSIVRMNKLNIEVYTRELTFAKDISNAKKLALIHAPRNGQISMHKRGKRTSAIIMKCPTSAIVPVLGYYKGYTMVQYDDAVGYVNSSSLLYLPAAQGGADIAYISMNGDLKSRNLVKIREEDNANSRALCELPCGQRVCVISQGEKYSLIEAEGIRGYILNSWLTHLTDEQIKTDVPAGRGTTASLFAGQIFLADTAESAAAGLEPVED